MGDVEASRRMLYSSRPNQPDLPERVTSSLTIYAYVLKEGDDLFGISARCNIPHGTLASLNRFSHADELGSGMVLLLSSIPGIFVAEKPETDLERLIYSVRTESNSGMQDGIVLSIPREGHVEQFRFIPGDDFSATERVYFLNKGFRFPLQNFRVTSSYGPRSNPVTGVFGIHRGLDLAAPEGSEVYAARSGTVIGVGEDPVMGKYIILKHDNDWVSFYGHLSSINTTLQAVHQSGNLIGRVGTTGQSTGPHLHFELRQGGLSQDPARLLGIFKDNF